MSLYDGLASSGKPPVVIDFGTRYTKFGFAGEFSPRCIVRTRVECPNSEGEGRLRWIFDYQNEEDLYSLLVSFIHRLYFRHGLVTPKDRDVVIVESLLAPTFFRDTLARVLFIHYEVPSVTWLPSEVVTLAGLGLSTGLVLDIGHSEAVLLPVLEGVPVLKAWQAQPLAAAAVHQRLRKNLIDAYAEIKNFGGDGSRVLRPTEVDLEALSEDYLEDIKVRGCFVTCYERGRAMSDGIRPPQPPFADFRLPAARVAEAGAGEGVAAGAAGEGVAGGGRPPSSTSSAPPLLLRVPGEVREASYEVLFERDNDQASLPNLILDAILACGVDGRRGLAENLVVTGGTAMAPGFKSRLLAELRHLVKEPQYNTKFFISSFKIHLPVVKENIAQWLGGSLYGATEFVTSNALTREKYLERRLIPDWSNLATNKLYLSKLTLA